MTIYELGFILLVVTGLSMIIVVIVNGMLKGKRRDWHDTAVGIVFLLFFLTAFYWFFVASMYINWQDEYKDIVKDSVYYNSLKHLSVEEIIDMSCYNSRLLRLQGWHQCYFTHELVNDYIMELEPIEVEILKQRIE